MKFRVFTVLGLVVAYVAAMFVGFFTVTQKEPLFPVPEYISLYSNISDEELIRIYEKNDKYYIEYVDDEYELTREEYLRLACINPDNFDYFIDEGSLRKHDPSLYSQMMIEIKYPEDRKAKQYDVVFNEVYHMPCWQLMFFRTVKININEDESYALNCALQETFDAYDVERGSGMCNAADHMRTAFFYGDSIEQMTSEEDCFEEDFYYQVMGEIVMYDLYEQGEIDAKDLTNDYDKMRDLIHDVTGKSLKKLVQVDYYNAMIPTHNTNTKVYTSELYTALFHLRTGHEIFLEEDSQLEILNKYYTFTDKYDAEGYYRVFTSDDQIVIVCISNDEGMVATVVAEGVDPLVKKQFINDVVETVFDQKEEGVKGHPAIMAHRILRAVVTTVIFVVLLVAVLVLFAVLKKFKKSAIATENAVAEAPKTFTEPAPEASVPIWARAEPAALESDPVEVQAEPAPLQSEPVEAQPEPAAQPIEPESNQPTTEV